MQVSKRKAAYLPRVVYREVAIASYGKASLLRIAAEYPRGVLGKYPDEVIIGNPALLHAMAHESEALLYARYPADRLPEVRGPSIERSLLLLA